MYLVLGMFCLLISVLCHRFLMNFMRICTQYHIHLLRAQKVYENTLLNGENQKNTQYDVWNKKTHSRKVVFIKGHLEKFCKRKEG